MMQGILELENYLKGQSSSGVGKINVVLKKSLSKKRKINDIKY